MRMVVERINALFAEFADKDYYSNAVRNSVASEDIEFLIQVRRNSHNPAPHDCVNYRRRSQIERLFDKLNNLRRVATPYDKTTESYISLAGFALTMVCMNYINNADFSIIV